jgi:hypothetical protein
VSYVIKYLPDLVKLQEELQDPNKLRIYRMYGGYVGSSESVKYLHERLDVDPEKKNT